MKVMTIVGTRPELIRLSRIIPLLDRLTDHTLVHTGQNYDYELNQVFFDDLGMRPPDHFLEAAGKTAAETVGLVIVKTHEILVAQRPDAVLILGDTNSCLAAYPAKRRKIPIFHMEAGNRCFDQRVPEEINRKIVDHISDINLPALNVRQAHERPEGMEEGTVMMVGLNWHRVQEGLSVLASQPRGKQRILQIVPDYTSPNVSEKVVRIVLSCTDYVNRVIWHRS